jgi:exonuclease SbcC
MEKEVQSAQKAAQDAEQIRIQIEAQSAVLAEQDKRLKSALENRDALHLQSVAAQTTLADARKQLPPQIRDEQAANQLLQEASREFETLQNTIQTARQKLQDAEQQQAAHQSSFVAAEAALKSRLEEQQEALAHADSQLIAEGFVDPQGVPSLDAARSAWILPATLSQRQQAHDLWKTALDQAQDRANRAQLEAEGLTPPDLSLLQQWVTRTEALTQSMSRKVGEITREFQARTQSVQALTQLTTARQEAASRQNALEWLDDLFTDGSLSGGKRETLPNFRKYVLAECISAVVDRANLRFRRLSRGRYEVRQKVTTVLGGKKSAKAASAGGASGDLTSDPVTVPPITFLTPELMIHDTYLQQDRPVSTLSGGETFQLSMALALGLAETITEAQGGIQLDTVFIDEGFGTLDSESLDLAIGVLTDLRDTGRVVGVISHVEELHQRMSARVEVRKGPSGASQILVHTAG